MKKIKVFLIFVVSIFLTNCQKEEVEEVKPPQNTNNIVLGSPLFELILRTSQNPTEIDNVLDNCSGFRVQLPVNVTVNGIAVNVVTTSDYILVKDIKDQYTYDDDIVYFDYPITVVYKNYESQSISNYTQFHNLVQSYTSDIGFNEIDCIFFNYPIIINTYEINNQIPNSITIQNNSQLYNFINELTSNELATIVYPISMINANAQNSIVNSNFELETFINNSIDDCNNNSGGSGSLDLTAVITSGSWYISYYFDVTDDTYNYNGYSFVFSSNGNSIATKSTINTPGTWEIESQNGIQKLDLNFEGDALSEIEEDWRVVEFTESIIRLKKTENNEIEYLYFTKN